MRIRKPPVCLDLASINAEYCLTQTGWPLIGLARAARILWMRKGYREEYPRVGPYQALNHIPGEGCITNKAKLTETLSAFKGTDEFYPESYCLYREDHVRHLLKILPHGKAPDQPWMKKLGRVSRGKGIQIITDFTEIREQIQDPQKLKELAEKDVLLQRYVDDPLLIDGQKSGVRAYFIVASIHPLLAFFYLDGTCPIAMEPYQRGNYEDLNIHLTNSCQHWGKEDYDPNQYKISYEALDERIGRPGFADSHLRPTLKEYTRRIVMAARKPLRDTKHRGQFFGVYRTDWVLDSNFNPWLTEVQRGPGLKVSDPLKAKLMPALLNESLEIVNEIMNRKDADEGFANLESLNRFQWVVGEP